MARHSWTAEPDTSGSAGTAGPPPAPGPVRFRTRFRIAAGAAVVVAGAALGTGIARVAGADLDRGAAQVVASVPLASGTARSPSPPGPQGTSLPSGPAGPAEPEAPAEGRQPAVLVVHVAGAVARPGIVRLPAGARVFEALAAAGGAHRNADGSALNLAAPVTDGQQIFVPSPDHPPPGGRPDAAAGGAAPQEGTDAPDAGAVNINTATAEELAALPRIGPVLAQRIVDFRQQHGPFTSAQDLDAVPGIGPGLLEALLDLVAV